jgi:hypothetical protein
MVGVSVAAALPLMFVGLNSVRRGRCVEYQLVIMTTQHDTAAKRWRPRFSVRTLAIFISLVCAYLGAWEATKKWGVRDVEQLAIKDMIVSKGSGWSGKPYSITCPAPFIVGLTQQWTYEAPYWHRGIQVRRHFIWAFGTIADIRHDGKYSDHEM